MHGIGVDGIEQVVGSRGETWCSTASDRLCRMAVVSRLAVLGLLSSLLCACHVSVVPTGTAPKIATDAKDEVSVRVVIDGGFKEDMERTVDWVVRDNLGTIRRVNDNTAAATIYLSTVGSPPTLGGCDVKLRAVDRDGKVLAEGTRSHPCSQVSEYGEGTKSAAIWALSETYYGLRRGGSADGGNSNRGQPASNAAGPAQAPDPKLTARRSRSERATSIALVIGIERYRRDLPAATGAATDARLFADHVELSLGVPRRNIHVLVDSDATKSSIEAELFEWLPRNTKASGEVFFYFAGHGAPEPTSGARYLVPWDADPKFIRTQGVSLEALNKHLESLSSRGAIAFVDACFSGAGGRSVLAPGTRPIVREKVPTPKTTKLLLLSATGPDQVTGTATSGHGLFSHFLFTGLNGEADSSRDGTVTLDELARFAAERVSDEARRDNRDQEPMLLGTGARSIALVRR